ncbi:hypothetical protein T4B_15110, partial [Trichinella pseudospiralis]
LAATMAESAGQCARCGVSKQGRREFSKAHLVKALSNSRLHQAAKRVSWIEELKLVEPLYLSTFNVCGCQFFASGQKKMFRSLTGLFFRRTAEVSGTEVDSGTHVRLVVEQSNTAPSFVLVEREADRQLVENPLSDSSLADDWIMVEHLDEKESSNISSGRSTPTLPDCLETWDVLQDDRVNHDSYRGEMTRCKYNNARPKTPKVTATMPIRSVRMGTLAAHLMRSPDEERLYSRCPLTIQEITNVEEALAKRTAASRRLRNSDLFDNMAEENHCPAQMKEKKFAKGKMLCRVNMTNRFSKSAKQRKNRIKNFSGKNNDRKCQ